MPSSSPSLIMLAWTKAVEHTAKNVIKPSLLKAKALLVYLVHKFHRNNKSPQKAKVAGSPMFSTKSRHLYRRKPLVCKPLNLLHCDLKIISGIFRDCKIWASNKLFELKGVFVCNPLSLKTSPTLKDFERKSGFRFFQFPRASYFLNLGGLSISQEHMQYLKLTKFSSAYILRTIATVKYLQLWRDFKNRLHIAWK